MALQTRVQDAAESLDEVRLSSDKRLAATGLALLLVPAIWFIKSDFDLYAHDWAKLQQRLLLRLILVVLPTVGILTMRRVKTRASYSNAVFWIAIAVAVVTVGLNSIRPAGSGLPLRSPVLILCIMYFAMPDTPVRQCVSPVLLSLGVIGLRMTTLGGGGVDVAGDVIAIASLNALGVLTIRRRVRLYAASSAVVGELRTLRGIIPICSHCRKLRSEVGDWQLIERYFQERGDALFSHGICPDCLREHYDDRIPESATTR